MAPTASSPERDPRRASRRPRHPGAACGLRSSSSSPETLGPAAPSRGRLIAAVAPGRCDAPQPRCYYLKENSEHPCSARGHERRGPRCRLAYSQPAIDGDIGARDVATLLRAEERHRVGDLFGFTQSPCGYLGQNGLPGVLGNSLVARDVPR